MTTYLGDGEALARYAAGAEVDTDDRAALEYRLADHVLRGSGEEPREIVRGLGARASPEAH